MAVFTWNSSEDIFLYTLPCTGMLCKISRPFCFTSEMLTISKWQTAQYSVYYIFLHDEHAIFSEQYSTCSNFWRLLWNQSCAALRNMEWHMLLGFGKIWHNYHVPFILNYSQKMFATFQTYPKSISFAFNHNLFWG